MNLRESVRFALRGVTANPMRSILTMSGILIGVAAVIILIAAGNGASLAIQNSISSLGSNTLTVTSASTAAGGRGRGAPGGFGGAGRAIGGLGSVFGGGGAAPRPGSTAASTVNNGTQVRVPALTLADAQALVDPVQAPDIASVAPVASAQSVTATFEGASHTIGTFTGTSPAYLVNDNDTIANGQAFTEADYAAHRRVALAGATVATSLVGGDGTGIVGQTVKLNGIDFQVVGLLTTKGSTGPQDQDDRMIAPLTAVQDTLTGYGTISSISVKATAATTVDAAMSEVTSVLSDRHHVSTDTPDFSIFNPASILAAVTATTGTFTILLAAVAGISLLVGGLGVMNIMLVTVTERTREIGIRKAIGAQRGDIVGQFLLEAVLLSLAGGLIGVLIGVVVGSLRFGTFQLVVAPYSVVLAFVVSVAIGLFFGFYPASRAAALRPIDALRYE